MVDNIGGVTLVTHDSRSLNSMTGLFDSLEAEAIEQHYTTYLMNLR